MNCSQGPTPEIPIEHEKYNLTNATPGDLTLAQTNNTYINLSSNAVIRTFELNYRQNDTVNKAVNATYWRMYVPPGVAGNCTGTIVFGAVVAAGI